MAFLQKDVKCIHVICVLAFIHVIVSVVATAYGFSKDEKMKQQYAEYSKWGWVVSFFVTLIITGLAAYSCNKE